ncbi:MAG: LacI family transcriptional regulator [Treponema sp.]|jgi:LacI family transcriptional regulator|nr:LacI family transcriptional regulator [Treponema sp.]
MSRIIDIARLAKVSPSTVSLVLNNKAGVSEEVRKRIIDISLEMGYKKEKSPFPANENITVKMLKIAKHGHIVNEQHNAFITEYLEGIETGARKRKYKLEVSFFNKIPVENVAKTLQDSAVDGFIILGSEFSAYDINHFKDISKPLVFIDTWFPLALADCVDIDNDDAVFKSIQYLYDCGHRSIGLIKSSYDTRNFRMREIGFRESMEYFSLPVQENFIVSVDPLMDRAFADLNKFFEKTDKIPTAFFCMSDIMAYSCMRALRNHNIHVPGDVSVTGFDNLPSSSVTDPPLTTVRVSTHQIGERALERLSDKINGLTHVNPEKILISGELMIRDSVRKIL